MLLNAGCVAEPFLGLWLVDARLVSVAQLSFLDASCPARDRYHPNCLFENLARGKVNKKKITSTEEIVGFDDLKKSDQKLLADKIRVVVVAKSEFDGCPVTYLEIETEDGPKFWQIACKKSKTQVRWYGRACACLR